MAVLNFHSFLLGTLASLQTKPHFRQSISALDELDVFQLDIF